jgi:hypothetical protein
MPLKKSSPLKKISTNKALAARGGAIIDGETATKIFTGIFAFNGGLTMLMPDAVGKGYLGREMQGTEPIWMETLGWQQATLAVGTAAALNKGVDVTFGVGCMSAFWLASMIKSLVKGDFEKLGVSSMAPFYVWMSIFAFLSYAALF